MPKTVTDHLIFLKNYTNEFNKEKNKDMTFDFKDYQFVNYNSKIERIVESNNRFLNSILPLNYSNASWPFSKKVYLNLKQQFIVNEYISSSNENMSLKMNNNHEGDILLRSIIATSVYDRARNLASILSEKQEVSKEDILGLIKHSTLVISEDENIAYRLNQLLVNTDYTHDKFKGKTYIHDDGSTHGIFASSYNEKNRYDKHNKNLRSLDEVLKDFKELDAKISEDLTYFHRYLVRFKDICENAEKINEIIYNSNYKMDNYLDDIDVLEEQMKELLNIIDEENKKIESIRFALDSKSEGLIQGIILKLGLGAKFFDLKSELVQRQDNILSLSTTKNELQREIASLKAKYENEKIILADANAEFKKDKDNWEMSISHLSRAYTQNIGIEESFNETNHKFSLAFQDITNPEIEDFSFMPYFDELQELRKEMYWVSLELLEAMVYDLDKRGELDNFTHRQVKVLFVPVVGITADQYNNDLEIIKPYDIQNIVIECE